MRLDRLEINSESDIKNIFDEMYQKAKEPKHIFHGMIELMTNEELIVTAIHNIKSNKGSKTHGVDKQDINNYLQMNRRDLISLVRNHISNYEPNPVRRVYIPKSNGKQRPLGIPTMIDRIIQELARLVLEPIAEAKFFAHSYGFRPYRSTEHALARATEIIRLSQTYYCIEGDIKGYFDNINHNKLIETLYSMGIQDKRFLTIIKKMLKAGVMEKDKFHKSDVGTPQGGIISPLLANIYLNHFDWMIAEEFERHPARYKVKNPETSGLRRVATRHPKCFLIRYADDWIILCQTKELAERLLSKVDKYFKHVLKIELSKEKTVITDLRKEKANFLGFQIFAQKARTKNKIVGKMIPNMKKVNDKVREISNDIKGLRKFKTRTEIVIGIEKINSKIVGISNYYCIANSSHIFKRLDQRLIWRTYKDFQKLYGKKAHLTNMTQARLLNNRLERHQRYKTKVFYVEYNGMKIGITQFQMTKSRRAMKFSEDITPYTNIGRQKYMDRTKKKLRLDRPPLYNVENLTKIFHSKSRDPMYNFEYFMNREYAYNRDRGQCSCCKTQVFVPIMRCHHIRPTLPIAEVNKVRNLTTLCVNCHNIIHGYQSHDNHNKETIERIRKLQVILTMEDNNSLIKAAK